MLEIFLVAEAVRVIFNYGFEIKDENLVELTFDQYQALKREGYDAREKWYRITRGEFEEINNPQIELSIIPESEIPILKKAVAMIYKMSDKSDMEFTCFSDRLDFLRTKLPAIMTAPLDPLPESAESDSQDLAVTAPNVVPFRLKNPDKI